MRGTPLPSELWRQIYLLDATHRGGWNLVVLELEGGYTTTASTFQNVTAYIYAYHRDSQGEALRLYDAIHAALQHQLLRRDGAKLPWLLRAFATAEILLDSYLQTIWTVAKVRQMTNRCLVSLVMGRSSQRVKQQKQGHVRCVPN